jgi:hypothetical protein
MQGSRARCFHGLESASTNRVPRMGGIYHTILVLAFRYGQIFTILLF